MPNATLVNFAGGETSPKSRGRFDIQSYPASCRKMRNFIAEVQGSARYRPGFQHLAGTTSNAIARMVPFHVSSALSYMLEFTPGKVQAYRDGEAVGTAVDTPYYTDDDVADLCPSNNGSSMYLTHWKYAPRLLLLTDVDTFSLITTPRINDPFGVTSVEENKTTVTAITRAAKKRFRKVHGLNLGCFYPTAGLHKKCSFNFKSVIKHSCGSECLQPRYKKYHRCRNAHVYDDDHKTVPFGSSGC
jgi:hypothetical protein